MVTRDGQVSALINWLAGLSLSKYELPPLELEDLERTAELLHEYSGTRLDFVDVTLVALAERLDIGEILTLDHRDFSIVRPRHREHFDLLPSR